MKFSTSEYISLCELQPDKFQFHSLEECYDFCSQIANSHYENFPIASIAIPKQERPHFYSIYAFARIADDLSDELVDISIIERIKLIEKFYDSLKNIVNGADTTNPVLKALANTISVKSIKIELFHRLITAFVWDAKREDNQSNYQATDYNSLIDYCTYSANPIGELVLKLFNEDSEINIALSDKICTALQLINFWQDLSRDLINNRLFVPLDVQKSYNVEIIPNRGNFEIIGSKTNIDAMLNELYNYTEAMLMEGSKLIPNLQSKRLKLEMALVVESGYKILVKIRNCKNIFEVRPKLVKFELIGIVVKSIIYHQILS